MKWLLSFCVVVGSLGCLTYNYWYVPYQQVKQYEQLTHAYGFTDLETGISLLEQNFLQTIADNQGYIECSKKTLSFLSAQATQTFKEHDGAYSVPVNALYYPLIMQQCKDQQVRKDMFYAYVNGCYFTNKKNLENLYILYRQQAFEKGYDTVNKYQLRGASLKLGEVEHMLESVTQSLQPKIQQLYATMGVKLDQFYSYDDQFVKYAYKDSSIGLTEQELAGYFPVEHLVKQAVQVVLVEHFALRAELIRFQDGVFVYQVYEDDQLLGTLCIDPYDRPGKNGQACLQTVRQRGADVPAELAIVLSCKNEGAHSCATFAEVTLLFHELGHAVFGLLCAKKELQTDRSLLVDLVEFPARYAELLLTDPKLLARLTAHVHTGQSLPEQTALQIVSTQKLLSWGLLQQQLYYSKVALALGHGACSSDAMQQLYKKVFFQYSAQEPVYVYTRLSHLVLYGSLYYGYVWSYIVACALQQANISGATLAVLYKQAADLSLAQELYKLLGGKPRAAALLA